MRSHSHERLSLERAALVALLKQKEIKLKGLKEESEQNLAEDDDEDDGAYGDDDGPRPVRAHVCVHLHTQQLPDTYGRPSARPATRRAMAPKGRTPISDRRARRKRTIWSMRAVPSPWPVAMVRITHPRICDNFLVLLHVFVFVCVCGLQRRPVAKGAVVSPRPRRPRRRLPRVAVTMTMNKNCSLCGGLRVWKRVAFVVSAVRVLWAASLC